MWALSELDLDVPAGTVLGLLGHNGAGKTTAVRILTTLTRPTTGSARIAGFDVVADAAAVRARIGLAAQAATVDGRPSTEARVPPTMAAFSSSGTPANSRSISSWLPRNVPSACG